METGEVGDKLHAFQSCVQLTGGNGAQSERRIDGRKYTLYMYSTKLSIGLIYTIMLNFLAKQIFVQCSRLTSLPFIGMGMWDVKDAHQHSFLFYKQLWTHKCFHLGINASCEGYSSVSKLRFVNPANAEMIPWSIPSSVSTLSCCPNQMSQTEGRIDTSCNWSITCMQVLVICNFIDEILRTKTYKPVLSCHTAIFQIACTLA